MVNALYVFALTATFVVLFSAAEAKSVGAAWVPSEVDYCRLKSCNGPLHTLCQYPFSQPARHCGRVLSSVLTPDEIQELLDVHNTYKYKRVPITWNSELADFAQTWANQCITRDDMCRNTQYRIVAQRHGFRKTTGPIKIGFSDLVDVNIIPRGTTIIGCGGIRFNPDGRFNWIYLVCNYANGGI